MVLILINYIFFWFCFFLVVWVELSFIWEFEWFENCLLFFLFCFVLLVN